MAFFTHEFDIGFNHTGNSNVTTNKAFLSFMEDIGGMHSQKAGFGMNEISKTHLSWLLIGWKLKVLSRPFYGSRLKVITWPRSFDKLYALRDFEIYDEKENLVAIATSKWILFNTETNKLSRITPEVALAYDTENKSVFSVDDVNFSIETEPDNILNTFDYIILRSNIDINNHMHNLFYLDLAYEALPEDIYKNMDLKNVEIIYKKECSLNDNVKCNYYFKNDAHYVYIKNSDNTILHAVIKLY